MDDSNETKVTMGSTKEDSIGHVQLENLDELEIDGDSVIKGRLEIREVLQETKPEVIDISNGPDTGLPLTTNKSVFVRIPKILKRFSTKEKAQQEKLKESEEGKETSRNGTTENAIVVLENEDEVGLSEIIMNGIDGGQMDDPDVSTTPQSTSFFSSFTSSPGWLHFKRVFTFHHHHPSSSLQATTTTRLEDVVVRDLDNVEKEVKTGGEILELIVDEKKINEGKEEEDSKNINENENSVKKSVEPLKSKFWMKEPKMGIILILILLLSTLTASVVFFHSSSSSRVIDIGSLLIGGRYINVFTSCGHVQGILEDDGGYVFRGIPYAQPPIGELRWRPAQLHSQISHCWTGTLDAKSHALPCWQFYRNGSYDGAEDCLYLDIYTPKPFYEAPVPVIVFISGDTLNGGESGESLMRPSAKLVVEKNVVFVTVSIRRSVLGFLTIDVLSRNSYPMTSGNYGLSDLLASLQWIKLNIQHFGGDPNHVTLLGHESGSSLALALLSSHLSQGLFHQVWVSGGSPPETLLSIQEAEAENMKFMLEINCTSIECLHNKGAEELLESVPNEWRMFHQDLPTRDERRHPWLIRDGVILQQKMEDKELKIPLSQLPRNSLRKIPFVAGTGAEVDASTEMYSYLNWNDTTKFSSYLESSLGSFDPLLSREVIDRYSSPESTPWETFASLLSDLRTICPLYYATLKRAQSDLPQVSLPVYFYVVTQRRELSPYGSVADGEIDITAILGTYPSISEEEKKFVENMQMLFYEFVHNGILPGGSPDVSKSILKIDENIRNIFTYPNCDFWKKHHFYPNHSRID